MKGIIAGVATLVIGFWAFPYIKDGAIDPLTTIITGLFPAMNNYLLLFLTWLPLIILGILVFAGVSLVLNLATGGRR